MMDSGFSIISELHRGERVALRKFLEERDGFVAVSRWARVGLPSLQSLVEKGLAVEGPVGLMGSTFKLTKAGRALAAQIDAVGSGQSSDHTPRNLTSSDTLQVAAT